MVFTLPAVFNELLPVLAKEVYSSLFAASWQTIQTFAADHKYQGAKTGMVSILHTWGQQFWLHPHMHCIVPGGGITPAGRWKFCKHKGKYLFPKRAMSVVFRARFMAELRKRMDVPQCIAKQAFKTNWVVYARRPFASPKTVVEYLGRYTHKTAISNHRLLDVNDQTVSFFYKDYKDSGKKKVATLKGTEFLRRFASHILPPGFVRIRHYGFLASRNKAEQLNIAKKELAEELWTKVRYSWIQIAKEKLNYDPAICPGCKRQTMEVVKLLMPQRAPPFFLLPHG